MPSALAPTAENGAQVAAPAAKDCCMGLNDCKGTGGCAVPESHACAGQNECRGQGGCQRHCPKRATPPGPQPNLAPRAASSAPPGASLPLGTSARPGASARPTPPAQPASSARPTPSASGPSSPTPDMLHVPGGEFVMGTDTEGELDERPAHKVTLRAFLLDKTEVTNAQYQECVKANHCRTPDSLVGSPLVNGQAKVFHLADHPVVGVSWDDARAYCLWRGKRLPREAEWERASRGADGRHFVWGNAAPDPKRHGVFGGQATTAAVGSFPEGKGPYGHLDLAGNAWEWQEDYYDPFAYQRPSAAQGTPGTCEQILQTQNQLRREGKQGFTGTNPIPTICERVLRGGAYNYRVNGLRASNRVHHPATFRIAVAGFRCACDP